MPFQKGQSGNPGGRKRTDPELRDAARKHTKKALQVLAAALDHHDPKVQILAANSLLDRGYGKPTQDVTGDFKGKLDVSWER